MGGTLGFPTLAKVPSQALDGDVAKRLWAESDALTGVRFGRPALIPAYATAVHA